MCIHIEPKPHRATELAGWKTLCCMEKIEDFRFHIFTASLQLECQWGHASAKRDDGHAPDPDLRAKHLALHRKRWIRWRNDGH